MMTFDEVMRARRMEQAASRLVKLDKDFYSHLKEFVDSQALEVKNSFSVEKAKEFENLKTAVLDLYSMREKKIVAQAIRASRTGSGDKDHLQPFERELFESLVEGLRTGRGSVESLFIEKHGPSVNGALDEKASPSVLGVQDLNKVAKVLVLEDLPAFVGVDLKEYGPFAKDSRVEVPLEVAGLLAGSGKAQIL